MYPYAIKFSSFPHLLPFSPSFYALFASFRIFSLTILFSLSTSTAQWLILRIDMSRQMSQANIPTLLHMSLVVRNPVFSGFSTMSNTLRTVQPVFSYFVFFMKSDCTFYVAKTKALISSTVTEQLICVFVFAYGKSQFSLDVAHMYISHITE